jgi:hypothetical protein
MGTAAFIPTIPVKAGSNTNAPPKPAAPEIVAARNEIANNMISSVAKFFWLYVIPPKNWTGN